MRPRPTAIDAYLATATEPARTTLQELRRAIKAVAPEAVESIGYGMPAFKYRGKPLAYFAVAKGHCALYGLNTEPAELAGYDTSRKGTIRFPPEKPLPEALVRTLLEERMAAIEAAEAGKRPKPRTRA